ncbi:two-component system response regulator [Caulobacter sp. Root1455]|uniref:winged helix-turn-helix domain-containing protein n=1 Tax=unclassified Caulobacter TaxID=2648921 RepID=UPI0006F7B035|nr:MULTISPECIES: winged helix-turn-helix domain-containing protein [unclassified Caulobacter]KQY35454.1 two-component system response regulator [Caulobacter sp. Root487D2Y]KQY93431.1 two-component system response regulator [Caulobacter sp. Root1455]
MTALRHRILVIDDEPQIHRFLGPALDAAGYEPLRADSGQEGLRGIALWSPDAVVLDLGLPDMDGKEVLTKARAFYDGPILILSARDREIEKIEALDRGANDYVEKPFGVGELLARLRAAIRHSARAPTPSGPIRAGDVEIDLEMRLVTRDGAAVKLSPKEYDLLARLAIGAGKVLTHKELLVAVWGAAHAHDTQYLRVFVGQLRQKLEDDPASPKIILTEPGVGYRFAA